MFNSPILDVTIGLVLIFFMYSLLATTINEAIAASFSLRARMLRNAIVDRMLNNAKELSRGESFWLGIKQFFDEALKIVGIGTTPKSETEKKIGDLFYDHPIIRNYASSKIFSKPSYITAKNFSTVLIDTLKKDFESKRGTIADYKHRNSTTNEDLKTLQDQLYYLSDEQKIHELLQYYSTFYIHDALPPFSILEKDTWHILQLHMQDSHYRYEEFVKKIEGWFDDTMDRVSGWYKRQVQTILFFLGLLLAVLFNVDTIEITSRLSKDKETRENAVKFAVEITEKYKDHPLVSKPAPAPPDTNGNLSPSGKPDSLYADSIRLKQYQDRLRGIDSLYKKDISEANKILALGWGDYGMRRDSAKKLSKYIKNVKGQYEGLELKESDSAARKDTVLKALYKDHYIKYKVKYVICESLRWVKILGFVLTAFAISLGAPFWFDLLNKLVKLRGTGTKEGNGASGTSGDPKSATIITPVAVQVQPSTGEEAVG